MQNWKATCTDGFTKTVMANSKDEAVQMFMNDMEMQEHVKTSHPEMAGKSAEEMTATVAGMVSAVEPEAPVAA